MQIRSTRFNSKGKLLMRGSYIHSKHYRKHKNRNENSPQIVGKKRQKSQNYENRLLQTRTFFDQLSKTLGFNSLQDYYEISSSTIYAHGGGKFMSLFNGSHGRALQIVYPLHEWFPWKFSRTPSSFWSHHDNIVSFF